MNLGYDQKASPIVDPSLDAGPATIDAGPDLDAGPVLDVGVVFDGGNLPGNRPYTGYAMNVLGFVAAPSNAAAGAAISPGIQVAVQDWTGNTLTTAFTIDVTIALSGGSGGATLSGTLTQSTVNGVATFPDLRIDQVGTGYTLTAIATGFTIVTSPAFDITAQ